MNLKLRVTAAVAGALVAAAIVAACSTSTDTTLTVPLTEIYVDPATFLGGTTDAGPTPLCGAGAGSLQTYVATLHDVTFDPAAGVDWVNVGIIDLPSSPPTRCSLDAAFGQVISGHMYVGEVDGYDRPICAKGQTSGDCLQALGGQNSGSRTMVDLSGNPVAPRWKTRCGDSTHRQADGGVPVGAIPDGPTFAGYELQIPLNACGPLEPQGEASAALLDVDVDALIQGRGCAAGTGIGKLVGTLRQTGEVQTSDVVATGTSCSAPVLAFGGASGLSPETTYDVDVVAYAAGSGLPTLGTTCRTTTHASASVTAPCGPLTSDGTLRVDVPALLAARMLTCGDVSQVTVSFGGGSTTTATAACPADVEFPGTPAGIYTVTARGYSGDPATGLTQLFASTCTATVTAGLPTTAACD